MNMIETVSVNDRNEVGNPSNSISAEAKPGLTYRNASPSNGPIPRPHEYPAARNEVPKKVAYLGASGLRLGDVVRSTEQHWLKTRQNFAGAIVRFERVPARAIASVRSDYWVYLNSGQGPISLAIIEKVRAADHSQRGRKAAAR